MNIQAISTNGKEKEMIATKPIVHNEGNKTTASFSVQANGKSYDIWFRTQDLPNGDCSNVALAATLLPAMKLNLLLRLEGTVSPKLLEGVSKIQEIFNTWDESYNLTKVIPETVSPAKNEDGRGIACFFSGGVDSFYTLLKNKEEITHIILVHGFDFRSDFKRKEETVKNISEIASKLGKTLVQVETNLRDFTDEYVSWGFCHGSALAAVALLFSGIFRKVLISSSHSFRWLVPRGSHPVVDPLWSIENLELIHDGCEATRVKKVAEIAKNDAAMSYLRVCWENREGAYNCGKCEKCLRTMINLLAVGALKKCKTFTHPLELSRVAWIEAKDQSTKDFILENLEEVKKLSAHSELAQALQESLDGLYYRGMWGWPRRAMNLLKRKGKFHHALNA